MPPLEIAGLRFLVSFDDLTFVAVPSVAAHAAWVLVDTARMVRHAVQQLGISTFLLDADAGICSAVIGMDLGIAVLSAQGAIMQPRRHEGALKGLIGARLVAGFVLVLIYSYAIVSKVRQHWLHEATVPVDPDELDGVLGGWGPVHHAWLPVWLVQLAMVSRLLIVVPSACFCFATLIPESGHARIMRSGARWILSLMGVRRDFVVELVKLVSEVVGQGTSQLIAPSDALAGLVLVAAGQRQGPLYHDPSRDGGAQMTSSAERACAIRGVRRPPRPLSGLNDWDREAARQVCHHVHFAIAIYGAGMELFTASVYQHTSLPSPAALCRAACRALSCCPPRQPHAEVVKDGCCGLNERAMHRVLADGARANNTKEPELIWATWENRGPLTCPPMAVLLDHELCNVVVTVRGTMDVKDCVSDLGAMPAFFDPLGEAGPLDARRPPFDERTGLFAHSTILQCAEDARRRLAEAGVLEALMGPGGRAHGWGLVCTGHSLGGGVACFLALMLRGGGSPYAAKARCVAIEPPGGLMSRRLSDLTGRLGFISAVCSHDWVPRISVRAVLDLRESILDELRGCDRSKFQLGLLACSCLARKHHSGLLTRLLCCCIGQHIAAALEWLGGGPLQLRRDGHKIACSHEDCARALPGASALLLEPGRAAFPELLPPAPVVYFRPTAQDWRCCGSYQFSPDWTAEWIQPEDLHEIILCPRSVELHFPNILQDAYLAAAQNLGAWEAGWLQFAGREKAGGCCP